MKYIVDDLDIDTVKEALDMVGYGLQIEEDHYGVCFMQVWTEKNCEGSGEIGGFVVGTVARNIGMFHTYTLTLTEFHNDRTRISGALNNILNRTTMR